MPQYSMARHVFVCMQGEHVVFLDVRKDRYFALEAAPTAGLGHLVSGWPIPAPCTADFARHSGEATVPELVDQLDHGLLSAVVSLLLEKGILVEGAQSGKSAASTMAEPVRSDLVADSIEERARIGMLQLVRFLTAAIRSRLLLKYRTFETVVERVRHRGEQLRSGAGAVSEPELLRLVRTFATIRPFFFAAKDACLFDALCLSEFLAAYRMYPRWVFGVQSRPFAAHCWLQLNDVVLNDTVDHVKRYTPVMVV